MKLTRALVAAGVVLLVAVAVPAALARPDPTTGPGASTAAYQAFETDFPYVSEPAAEPVSVSAPADGTDWTPILMAIGVGVAAMVLLVSVGVAHQHRAGHGSAPLTH